MHDCENKHSHCENGHTHGTGGEHENQHKTPKETAALLKYTLKHNAHHRDELRSLAHDLQHMQLNGEAEDILICVRELEETDKRLEAVMDKLQ